MPDCEHVHTVHVAVYDQWYCTDCNSYMPRGWLPEHIECPYCHDFDTRYIERYDRYFCNGCNVYLPEGYGPPRHKNQGEDDGQGGDYSSGDTTIPDPTDPTSQIQAEDKCCYCGGPLVYIPELPQYRCDHCESYQPKGYGDPTGTTTTTDKCLYCGGPNIVEIERYHQFFCRDCITYLPKGTIYVQSPAVGGGTAPVENAVAGPFVLDDNSRIKFDNLIPMSELNMNGCGKQIFHHGPIVLVKKYNQYYCENCNHFTNIGWAPLPQTAPPT